MAVGLATPAGQWQLTATCAPDEHTTSIAAGHILKKGYIYLAFSNIPSGESRTLQVGYSASPLPDGTASVRATTSAKRPE